MFPLAGKDYPESAEALESAINDALSEVFKLNGSKSAGAHLEGGNFPSIKTVKIDLDDATVSASKPPPKPIPTGKHREPGPKVERLDLSAQPIHYEQAKFIFLLDAAGLEFEFDRVKGGVRLVLLTEVKTVKV